MLFAFIASNETPTLIDAQRQRPCAVGHIAQTSAELAKERVKHVVQRRGANLVEIGHCDMILQITAYCFCIDQRFDTGIFQLG